jgi:hypothetical protein
MATSEAAVQEMEIWRAARLMIRVHGDDAAVQANIHVLENLQFDDPGEASKWRRIVSAIVELQAPPTQGIVKH